MEAQSIVVALSLERSDPQEGHVCEPPSLSPRDNPALTSLSVFGNAAHSSAKTAVRVEGNLPQVFLHFSLLSPAGGGSAATAPPLPICALRKAESKALIGAKLPYMTQAGAERGKHTPAVPAAPATLPSFPLLGFILKSWK